MVDKYIYKEITVNKHSKKVYFGYNKNYSHYVNVNNYKRKQRFLNPEYVAHQHAKKHGLEFKSGTGTGKYKDLLAHQVLHQDWSHMSEKYPNIIGLTDIEIDTFIDTFNYDDMLYPISKSEMKQYIKQIKCYNDTDLTQLSQKMYDEWEIRMGNWYQDQHYKDSLEHNKFSDNNTIYVTSPRGGNEILTIFSYANYKDVKKHNLPFDWKAEKYKRTLEASALPYSHNAISDVNDIVFLDDIFMSGEQFGSALNTIKSTLKELDIKSKELPRLHYMAIAGNMPRVKDKKELIKQSNYKAPTSTDDLNWFSITIGDKRKFDHHYSDPYPFTSACVFPFSIPDGNHHRYARKLYDKYHKFPHRKYT